jgi:hypothetical protein
MSARQAVHRVGSGSPGSRHIMVYHLTTFSRRGRGVPAPRAAQDRGRPDGVAASERKSRAGLRAGAIMICETACETGSGLILVRLAGILSPNVCRVASYGS